MSGQEGDTKLVHKENDKYKPLVKLLEANLKIKNAAVGPERKDYFRGGVRDLTFRRELARAGCREEG